MVTVMAAVEGGLADALLLGKLGQLEAHRLGSLDVAAISHLNLLGNAARRRQGQPFFVVDQLGVDVLGAAKDRQPRPLRCPQDATPHMPSPAPLPMPFQLLLVHDSLPTAGERLAFLAPHLFAVIANALALVWFRLAHAARAGSILADLLLVVSLDDDGGRIGQFHRDALRRWHLDRIGVADRQHQFLLVHAGLIADALDLEALFVSLGDALDHVGHERTRQAVQRAVLAFVIGADDGNGLGLVVNLDFHGRVRRELELALGPLDLDLAVGHLHLDAAGNRYGLFTDPGHALSLPTCMPLAAWRSQETSRAKPQAATNSPHLAQ